MEHFFFNASSSSSVNKCKRTAKCHLIPFLLLGSPVFFANLSLIDTSYDISMCTFFFALHKKNKEQKLRTNSINFFVQVSKREYLSIRNNSIIYSFIRSFILHNKCKSQQQQRIVLRNLVKKYQRNLIPEIPLIFLLQVRLHKSNSIWHIV